VENPLAKGMLTTAGMPGTAGMPTTAGTPATKPETCLNLCKKVLVLKGNFQGIFYSARALHALNLIWFGYNARLSQWD
jgi:hypothetical protein